MNTKSTCSVAATEACYVSAIARLHLKPMRGRREVTKPSSTGCFASFVASQPTLAAPGMLIGVIMLKHGSAQGAVDAFRTPRFVCIQCITNAARTCDTGSVHWAPALHFELGIVRAELAEIVNGKGCQSGPPSTPPGAGIVPMIVTHRSMIFEYDSGPTTCISY